jgi:hypothetical protein
LTYDEIAQINFRSEGWLPHRSSVLKRLQHLGLPARNASHKDLIPWRVREEHTQDRLRYMLQAESRKRQNLALTESDLRLIDGLHGLLFGRGKLMVVGYHPDVGFHLVERADEDDDIIRAPRNAPAPDLSDEELAQCALIHGRTPEDLETQGRDRAADLLRALLAENSRRPRQRRALQKPAG